MGPHFPARHLRRALQSLIVVLAVTAVVPGEAAAQGISPQTATAAQKKQAQAKYEEGVRLADAGQRDQALEAFQASYAIVASPNSLLMVGRMQAELGDPVTAYETYEALERDVQKLGSPKYDAAASAARQEREELRARIALVTVRVVGAEAGTRVTLGSRELAPDKWGSAVPTKPGPIEARATAPSGRTVQQRAEAAGGGTTELALDFTPAPPAVAPPPPIVTPPPAPPATATRAVAPPREAEPPAPSLLPYAIAAGAVGVVGLGTFIIAGAVNRSAYDDLLERCPGQKCTEDARGDIDSGRRAQTIANVGAVFGVLGAGAGITLLLIDRSISGSNSAARPGPAGPPRATLEPWVGAGAAGVRGGF